MEENVTAELDKYRKGNFDVETKRVNFRDNTYDFFFHITETWKLHRNDDM